MSGDLCLVLLVEDDEGQALLVQRALSRAHDFGSFSVRWVASLAEALEALDVERYDVALVDLTLPDSRGLDTLVRVHQRQPGTPIVVLTSLESDRTVRDALLQGAQDYLIKERLIIEGWTPETLDRSIRYAICRNEGTLENQRLVERLRSQQQLLEQKNHRLTESNKTAQRVVENVSHEFRTPLTVIKEYVSLVCEGMLGAVNVEQQRYLNVAYDRTEDLNRMVDDMLDVSKLDAGLLTMRRSPCSIQRIVEHILPSLARKATIKGIALELAIDDSLPLVFCDPDKVARIVGNLLVNAIKFSGDLGHVRLWAREDPLSSNMVVGLTDNGPGLAPGDQQRIFDRFTQVDLEGPESTKGFGLGLNIVKEMVGLNFGTITVHSESGRGSTFAFTLPLARPSDVARRFLAHSLSKNPECTSATLVRTQVHESADQEACDDIDRFLNYVVRPDQLLLRTADRNWVIIQMADGDASEDLRRRIEGAWTDANRNRVKGPLPELETGRLGTWPANTETDALLACLHTVTADGLFIRPDADTTSLSLPEVPLESRDRSETEENALWTMSHS